MTKINLIWAEDLDGWIGKDNHLPWHVSADMRHFRQLTANNPIIMGWNTYESLGKQALPHRQNIVLTHRKVQDDQVTVFHTVDELKEYITSNSANFFVIGGSKIYQQMLSKATDLYRTVINQRVNGDTKMPAIDYHRWHLVDRTQIDDQGQVVCWFEHWKLNVK